MEMDLLESRLKSVDKTWSSTREVLSSVSALRSQCKTLLNSEEFPPDHENKEEKIPAEITQGYECQLYFRYFRWVSAFKTLDNYLDKHLNKEEETANLISAFRRLSALNSYLQTGSQCRHLKNYSSKLFLYWQTRFTFIFNEQFNALISKLNWPAIILESPESQPSTTSENIHKFRLIFGFLEELNVCPLGILLKPLIKRFKFHFLGNKKTNTFEKPEWYLQQMLLWVKNSEKFFQSVFDDSRYHEEFISLLLDVLNSKIESDLRELIFDDVLFSHLIDEILKFSNQVSSLGFLNAENEEHASHLPIKVLLKSGVFNKWINLERKFAFEKLDDIFLDGNEWSESSSKSQVAKCGVKFLALLTSMSDRYKILIRVDLKLTFVTLQNELIEDFRLRVVQVLKRFKTTPMDDKFILIINSTHHISAVIEKWSEIPMFMKLEYDSKQEGLFEKAIGPLNFVVDDSIHILKNYVIFEIKSRNTYNKLEDDDISLAEECSASSLPILHLLSTHLFFCHNKLIPDLFNYLCKEIIDEFRRFLCTDVILRNTFSENGCKRLNYDIVHGYLPIFNQYYLSDGNYLIEDILELSVILKLSNANALLLKDSLLTENSGIRKKKMLEEFKIKSLDDEQVVEVLNHRILIIDENDF